MSSENVSPSYYTGQIYRGLNRGFEERTVLLEDGYIIEDRNPVYLKNIQGLNNELNVIINPLFFNAHTHLGDSMLSEIPTGRLDDMVIPPHGLKHR